MAKTVGKRRPATGRPSKYDAGFCAEFPELARKLALLGATDKEMAGVFGVALSTFSEWKVKYEPFAAALNTGKLVPNANVVDALYRKAMGHGKPGDMNYIAPDTGACVFWLKNRCGWRDKVETGITDADGKDVSPTDPMEAIRRLAFLLHKGAQAS